MSHPLEGLGKLLTLAGLVTPAALGFMAEPALVSILVGSLILTLGYTIIRFPQMYRLYKESTGGKFLLAPVYLIAGHCILSGAIYGIARLFS